MLFTWVVGRDEHEAARVDLVDCGHAGGGSVAASGEPSTRVGSIEGSRTALLAQVILTMHKTRVAPTQRVSIVQDVVVSCCHVRM